MSHLYQSLGQVVAFKQTKNGVLLSTDAADVRITIYSESVIRVYIEKTENEARELPYAVVEGPQKTEFEIKETEDVIFIKTSKIKVLISRKPLRISFTDLNGKFLNEDDCALGTGWMGDTV
ncbi:MAG: DUF4968 domain-containing protein, partial [Flavobacteriales bacterium]